MLIRANDISKGHCRAYWNTFYLLYTHFHLLAGLRMSGLLLPLPIYAFMGYLYPFP